MADTRPGFDSIRADPPVGSDLCRLQTASTEHDLALINRQPPLPGELPLYPPYVPHSRHYRRYVAIRSRHAGAPQKTGKMKNFSMNKMLGSIKRKPTAGEYCPIANPT